MILIDTSAWIDFFRGISPASDEVDRLLAENGVALCGPVLCELRRGIVRAADRKRVVAALAGCHPLPQPPALWTDAGDLGHFVVARGFAAKTLDLLIATYALYHEVPLLTSDADFARMVKAGVPLLLA